jgi:hypothetical protein
MSAPSEEHLRRAREWLGNGHHEAVKRTHREEFTANLAALLADEYARGWAACRERAAKSAEQWGMPPCAMPRSAMTAAQIAAAIRALEPEGA